MNDDIEMAKACSDAMYANDAASRMLGIEVVESTPGCARAIMTVCAEFTNGHDICHGGYIFMLADSAFAYACNNRNKSTVASAASIEFVAPAHTGDRLTAVAHERIRGSKIGVYDVEVFNQDDRLLALFRGDSYQIRGDVLTFGEGK
ncbi:MAG: hydroxyphenylacetyl-CoA thioesterase PaaI [Gammaproteobacteria bacterium]|nr:hydroxyphenylacetyl-CoA thioesterase PaaI [Gammaproteobacteria bacterium]